VETLRQDAVCTSFSIQPTYIFAAIFWDIVLWTDVSEERITSSLRVKVSRARKQRAAGAWRSSWYVSPKRRLTYELHSVISQTDSHTKFSPFYHGGVLQSFALPALTSQHTIFWLYLNVSIQIANKLRNLKKKSQKKATFGTAAVRTSNPRDMHASFFRFHFICKRNN
jgi:hypothetical protein